MRGLGLRSGEVAGVLAVVMVAALLSAPGAAATAGGLVSDDFSAGLDASRWSVVDPLGDASVGVMEGVLEIGVPGGVRHNPWVPNEAPRVVQQLADSDLDVVARFDSVPSQAFQMQGLVFEESPGRFVRLEVHHDGSSLRAYAASVVDGAGSARVNQVIPAPRERVWLRVTRVGDSWTLRYSYDGGCWTVAGGFTQALAVTAGGVFAGNSASSPAATPAFTARVDYVENLDAPLARPPAPAPPPGAALVSDDFSDGLDATRWALVDPLGDATVDVADGRLLVGVPGGQRHDPGVCNDAPRLLQPVDGGDLDVVAKFDSLPSEGFQMQGLVFEESPSRFVRFDVHHTGSTLRAYGASSLDGAASARFTQPIPAPPGPLWLRVERAGDTWTLRHADDGQTWQTAGSFTQPLAVTAGGVFAGNWASSPAATPAFAAEVAYVDNQHAPLGSDPDPPPLDVEMTQPVEGAVVFADTPLAAEVSDSAAVDRVEFTVDGEPIGTVDQQPYELVWDTIAAPDGERVVQARAVASSGAHAVASVTVTVANDLDDGERIDSDFEHGALSVDDHARYGFWAIMGDERLPARYQAGGVDEHAATGWGLTFASNFDDLHPDTRQELQDYFTAEEEPIEGMSAMSSGFPDCDLGVRIRVGLARYHCRTEIGPFRIVYDLDRHHPGRGVPEHDDLDSALAPGGNGVPDFVDRIAHASTRSLSHFTGSAQLGYSQPAAPITVVVWGEGQGGFAPPPQLAANTYYIANRHASPQYLSAHELFHIIQYGYIGAPALRAPLKTWWWMEATAEWAAHQAEWFAGGWSGEVHGRYAADLPRFLSQPTEPLATLDNPSGGNRRQYGAFILAEYLDMTAGRDSIRGTWQRLESDPRDAIAAELQAHGRNLADELPRFARATYFLDYAIPARLTAPDVNRWRDYLDLPSLPTRGDAFWFQPRPARQHQADLNGDEPDVGSVRVEAGGAAYLEFRPSGPGLATVAVGANRADVHVQAVGAPLGCGVDTTVLSRTDTQAQVDVAVPGSCDLLTLVVTHTDAHTVLSGHLGWEVDFAPAQGRISNGLIALGVTSLAHLGVAGTSPSSGIGTTRVALRYLPTNAEGFGSAVKVYEGWGVEDAISGTGGYAHGGHLLPSSGLELEAATFNSSRGTSIVTAAEGRLRVTHDFNPSPATPNLYEITVTIHHVGTPLTGSGPVDVRYRRVLNWDIEPTPYDEFVTIQPTSIRIPPELTFSSNDGYAHALGDDQPDRGASGFFTNHGPKDQGALFDWHFGQLARGESVTFTLFYGAAATQQQALDALDAVDADLYSLGQPNTPGGPTQGTPNTFVFAYRSPE